MILPVANLAKNYLSCCKNSNICTEQAAGAKQLLFTSQVNPWVNLWRELARKKGKTKVKSKYHSAVKRPFFQLKMKITFLVLLYMIKGERNDFNCFLNE